MFRPGWSSGAPTACLSASTVPAESALTGHQALLQQVADWVPHGVLAALSVACAQSPPGASRWLGLAAAAGRTCCTSCSLTACSRPGGRQAATAHLALVGGQGVGSVGQERLQGMLQQVVSPVAVPCLQVGHHEVREALHVPRRLEHDLRRHRWALYLCTACVGPHSRAEAHDTMRAACCTSTQQRGCFQVCERWLRP